MRLTALDVLGEATGSLEFALDDPQSTRATRCVPVSIADPASFAETYRGILLQGDCPLILNPGLPIATRNAVISSLSGRLPESGHILCTSGTTSAGGNPKAFFFPIERAMANGRAHAESLGLGSGDRIVLPMPLSHSFGLVAGLLGSASIGASLWAFEATPDPATLLGAAARFEASLLYLTPTLARLLLRRARHRPLPELPELERISIGAAAFSRGEMRELQVAFPGVRFYFTYGLTELGPRVSTFSAGSAEDPAPALLVEPSRPVPIGQPLAGVSLVVQKPDTGGVGRLWVDSAYASVGRWSNGEVIPLERPFDTADAARGVGEIEIVGRCDGTIIVGGLNIYPEDVERVAMRIDGVAGACLVGRPSAMYGEVAVLVVEAAPNAVQASIQDALSRELPATHQPAEIRFVTELPRTSMAKIRRADVRARLLGNAP